MWSFSSINITQPVLFSTQARLFHGKFGPDIFLESNLLNIKHLFCQKQNRYTELTFIDTNNKLKKKHVILTFLIIIFLYKCTKNQMIFC